MDRSFIVSLPCSKPQSVATAHGLPRRISRQAQLCSFKSPNRAPYTLTNQHQGSSAQSTSVLLLLLRCVVPVVEESKAIRESEGTANRRQKWRVPVGADLNHVI